MKQVIELLERQLKIREREINEYEDALRDPKITNRTVYLAAMSANLSFISECQQALSLLNSENKGMPQDKALPTQQPLSKQCHLPDVGGSSSASTGESLISGKRPSGIGGNAEGEHTENVCPACNGEGWYSIFVKCNECEGTGKKQT